MIGQSRSARGAGRAPAFLLLFLGLSGALPCAYGREFQKPLEVLAPQRMIRYPEERLLSGSHWEFALHQHAFSDSPHDVYHIQSIGAVPLYQRYSRFTLAMFYGTFLVNGPVAPDEEPASVAEWWMNGIQFEYGLVGAFTPRGALSGFELSGEYSRRSFHPIRSGYEVAAADILRAGVARVFSAGSVTVRPHLRLAHIDLYDFWQSDITKPRAFVALSPTLFLNLPIRRHAELRARGELDLIALRSGGHDYDLYLELGAALMRSGAELVMGINLFRTGDTEIVKREKTPVLLSGFFVRLAARSPAGLE